MQPDELDEDRTGKINEAVASVLEGKHPSETITSCATLETYEETPIFIPVKITEEVVGSVARKLSGSFCQGGMDSEALQGCLLKFGEDSTRLHTSVETFCVLVSQWDPALGDLPCIYARPPDRARQTTWRMAIWLRVNVAESFCQDCAKGHRNRSNHGMLVLPAVCRT